MATIPYGLNAVSSVADGGVAHIIDTGNAYATGTLVSFRENGTQYAFMDSSGHFNLIDNGRATFGTGGDADIYYDATDLIINPKVAGSGVVVISGDLSSDGTTDSTSTTSGAIHTDGGLGVAKDLVLGSTSTIFVGDTTNANMTAGITINQGANDDEILALKSSDIAHGITTQTETDTYGWLAKLSATGGGLLISGVTDTDGAAGEALYLQGLLGEAADTTKSTSGLGIINVDAHIKDGTGLAVPGADGNLFTVQGAGTTRYIWDVEGSAHADVEWTTFDEHDDIAILDDLESLLVPNMFGQAVHHDAEFFKREKLINDIRQEDGKTRGMINMSKMTMLTVGACRQLGQENKILRKELDDVKLEMTSMMKLLKGSSDA